jgi:Bacterial low temperature requirement A protein (LtrA)
MTSETYGRFKRWFWRPPRAHGETIADRQVSDLELFYDLVYVAVIGQAAHHLAEHVSARGLAEFAVIFALIWIADATTPAGTSWLLAGALGGTDRHAGDDRIVTCAGQRLRLVASTA